MNPLLIDKVGLVCPICRTSSSGRMIDYHLILDDASKMVNGYVVEGVLCCSNQGCRAQYPIRKGIPCIFRSENSCRSYPLSKMPTAPYVSYLDAHYAPYCEPRPLISNTMFWQTVSDACPMPESVSNVMAIDLGCATGRFTFMQANHCAIAVGLDTNFDALAVAAALQRGEAVSFHRGVRAMAIEQVKICFSAPENVFFILSDALDPPFRAESFQFTAALNLVDSITNPLILLKQMDDLLEPGGSLLLTSPFAWKDTICDQSQWLEDMETPPDSFLQQILTGKRFQDADFNYATQSDIHNIPWSLPVAAGQLSVTI